MAVGKSDGCAALEVGGTIGKAGGGDGGASPDEACDTIGSGKAGSGEGRAAPDEASDTVAGRGDTRQDGRGEACISQCGHACAALAASGAGGVNGKSHDAAADVVEASNGGGSGAVARGSGLAATTVVGDWVRGRRTGTPQRTS